MSVGSDSPTRKVERSMPVVMIKGSRKPGKGRSDLMARVQLKAETLLRDAEACVLVVYGEQDASIYYEGQPSPRALPRPG